MYCKKKCICDVVPGLKCSNKSTTVTRPLLSKNLPTAERSAWSSVKGAWPGVSLFAAVVSSHHQVAVGAQVFDAGGPAAVDGRRLSLHPRELQHAARVVLEQVALEGLPASANTHHHVFVVQHLWEETGLKCHVWWCRLSKAEPLFHSANGGLQLLRQRGMNSWVSFDGRWSMSKEAVGWLNVSGRKLSPEEEIIFIAVYCP